eukprot:scaffold529_cov308-Pinguiococcus_pyrenoidosus.AAC.50
MHVACQPTPRTGGGRGDGSAPEHADVVEQRCGLHELLALSDTLGCVPARRRFLRRVALIPRRLLPQLVSHCRDETPHCQGDDGRVPRRGGRYGARQEASEALRHVVVAQHGHNNAAGCIGGAFLVLRAQIKRLGNAQLETLALDASVARRGGTSRLGRPPDEGAALPRRQGIAGVQRGADGRIRGLLVEQQHQVGNLRRPILRSEDDVDPRLSVPAAAVVVDAVMLVSNRIRTCGTIAVHGSVVRPRAGADLAARDGRKPPAEARIEAVANAQPAPPLRHARWPGRGHAGEVVGNVGGLVEVISQEAKVKQHLRSHDRRQGHRLRPVGPPLPLIYRRCVQAERRRAGRGAPRTSAADAARQHREDFRNVSGIQEPVLVGIEANENSVQEVPHRWPQLEDDASVAQASRGERRWRGQLEVRVKASLPKHLPHDLSLVLLDKVPAQRDEALDREAIVCHQAATPFPNDHLSQALEVFLLQDQVEAPLLDLRHFRLVEDAIHVLIVASEEPVDRVNRLGLQVGRGHVEKG